MEPTVSGCVAGNFQVRIQKAEDCEYQKDIDAGQQDPAWSRDEVRTERTYLASFWGWGIHCGPSKAEMLNAGAEASETCMQSQENNLIACT